MLLVVGGVSGVGKSTVGALLAEALGLPFYDADDFHPAANMKESYRRKLASQCSEDVTWIMLDGSPDLLTARLDSRKGHFFDQSLLESQFADLELPSDGWVVDARSSPEEIVDTILDLLRGK